MAKIIRILVGEHDSFTLHDIAQIERKNGTRVFVNFDKLKEEVKRNEIHGHRVQLLGGTVSDCLPKSIKLLTDFGAQEISLRAREIRLGGDDLFPDCNLELRISTLRSFLDPKNEIVKII